MWALILALLGTTYAAGVLYSRYKPVPPGIAPAPEFFRVPSSKITFLYDLTAESGRGYRLDQSIMETVYGMIRDARKLVIIDSFLFNLNNADYQETQPKTTRVVESIRASKAAVLFISDPFNMFYGKERCRPLEDASHAGACIVITDVDKLRDNNMFYGALWRLLLQWVLPHREGFIPHPIKRSSRIPLRALLKALNTRANHRKAIVADKDGSWSVLLASANFDDASSYFCNTAVLVEHAGVARKLASAELAVARMSGLRGMARSPSVLGQDAAGGDALVTTLFDDRIRASILKDIHATLPGDTILVAMLFLAERSVIKALKRAARRGVSVNVVLDRNSESFGQKKRGLPNQQVAAELGPVPGINLRWYAVESEEFHSKAIIILGRRMGIIHTGSANLTRRSLSGTNLEANIRVEAPRSSEPVQEAERYINKLLHPPYTVPYRRKPHRKPLYLLYRLQEATGLGTF